MTNEQKLRATLQDIGAIAFSKGHNDILEIIHEVLIATSEPDQENVPKKVAYGALPPEGARYQQGDSVAPQQSSLVNTDVRDMVLRDYFAAQAMQGICSSGPGHHGLSIAAKAYQVADAMLDARK